MKTIPTAFILLVCCLCCVCVSAQPLLIAVPDPALESAIEAHIGNNTVAGFVDGDWLLGRDSAMGAYKGKAGGLTALGFEEETPSPLSGVRDLTGLEAAANLTLLFLRDSPVLSLEPLLPLEKLAVLGLDACGISDEDIRHLLSASFSLTAFALINAPEDANHPNAAQLETVSLFLSRHPDLRRVALTNLGLEIDLHHIADALRFSDMPCDAELYLAQNKILFLEGLSSFRALSLLDLNSCGITDDMLTQTDWSLFSCLKTLNLVDNDITDIAPLLNLRPSAKIDLYANRLDAVSIAEHVPALEQAGHEVRFEMELFIEVEGEGDVPPEPGRCWHPYGASTFRLAVPRPNSNHGFIGWRGDVVSEDYGVTLDMTAHRRLTAVFSETPAPGRRFIGLSIDQTGSGQGALSPRPGRSLYRDGETVSLQAAPAPDSYFGGWHIVPANDNDPEHPPRHYFEPRQTLELTSDISVAARFDLAGHHLTLKTIGQGDLSLPPDTYRLTDGAALFIGALPKPGWRLRHWEDESGETLYTPQSDDDTSFTLVLTEDMTVQAVFEEATRTLTILIEEEQGASGVTSPPGDAQGRVYVYQYGETAKVRARPGNAESAFAGWQGDAPEEFGRTEILQQDFSLPMTENRVVIARFVPAEVTLSMDVYLDGRPFSDFLPSDQRNSGYIRDAENRIPINLDLGGMPYAFDRWEGDVPEDVNATDSSIVLPMDRDRHLIIMLQMQNTVTVGLRVVGEGKTKPRPNQYSVVRGRRMNFSIESESMERFAGWRVHYEDGMERTLITPDIDLDIPTSASVEAHFSDAVHRLWIGATDEGGTLTPPPGVYRVADGLAVDLEAVPPEGSAFYHWATDDGRIISESPHTHVLVTEDVSCHAIFGPPGKRLTVTTGGAGSGTVSVSPEGGAIRPTGSTVELRAVPDSDSLFTRWEGITFMGVVPTAPVIPLTLDQDRHIVAVFDKANYQLTLEVAGLPEDAGATLSPAPGVHGYRTHDEVPLFAAPPPGNDFVFIGWEGSLEHSDKPQHTVRMGQDRYVVARFAPVETVNNSVTLTVLPSEGDGVGSIEPLSPGTYAFIQNALVDFSFILDSESYFGGWTGDYEGDISYHKLPVILNKNKTIGARFTAMGALLTIGLNNSQAGTVSPPPGTYRLSCDLEIVLTATRTSTQWQFAGWFDEDGRSISPYARHVVSISPHVNVMTCIAVFNKPLQFSPIEYAYATPVGALRCTGMP